MAGNLTIGVRMAETIDSVIEFWFGKGQTTAQVNAEKAALWWGKDAATDSLIRQRFAALTQAVAGGEKNAWQQSPRGLLAMIICLDQFPRNLYRDSARAFEYDPQALSLARQCIAEGAADALRPIERVFVFLPFEHSESLEMQNQSLQYYQSLLDAAATDEREMYQNTYDFACRHFEIIERFGRFPHRNHLLGRASTAAEQVFLQQPNSSF